MPPEPSPLLPAPKALKSARCWQDSFRVYVAPSQRAPFHYCSSLDCALVLRQQVPQQIAQQTLCCAARADHLYALTLMVFCLVRFFGLCTTLESTMLEASATLSFAVTCTKYQLGGDFGALFAPTTCCKCLDKAAACLRQQAARR